MIDDAPNQAGDSQPAKLTPRQRELFDQIAARPGGGPRDYAGSDDTRAVHRATDIAGDLADLGLIERTGTSQQRRYWLAGQVPDGERRVQIGRHAGTSPSVIGPAYGRVVAQIERSTAELVAIIERQQARSTRPPRIAGSSRGSAGSSDRWRHGRRRSATAPAVSSPRQGSDPTHGDRIPRPYPCRIRHARILRILRPIAPRPDLPIFLALQL